jgi:hypothetical protein
MTIYTKKLTVPECPGEPDGLSLCLAGVARAVRDALRVCFVKCGAGLPSSWIVGRIAAFVGARDSFWPFRWSIRLGADADGRGGRMVLGSATNVWGPGALP